MIEMIWDALGLLIFIGIGLSVAWLDCDINAGLDCVEILIGFLSTVDIWILNITRS